jgi:hypothetical protein
MFLKDHQDHLNSCDLYENMCIYANVVKFIVEYQIWL